jgi:hypothetical protein
VATAGGDRNQLERGRRISRTDGTIFVGVTLLVVSLFLPWLRQSIHIGSLQTIETSGWDKPEVWFTVLATSAATLIAVLAPVGWIRYPVTIAAGAAAGGLAFAWAYGGGRQLGSWIAVLGAALVVISAFAALRTRAQNAAQQPTPVGPTCGRGGSSTGTTPRRAG